MDEFPNLDAADFRLLFQQTDNLKKLRYDPGSLSIKDYKDILIVLCGSLDDAMNKGLEKAVRSRLANDATVQQQARAIVGDVKAYVEFLKFEHELLIKCGVSDDGAKEIIDLLYNLRQVFMKDTQYDADKVWDAVQRFRHEVCNTAQQIKQYVADERQRAEDRSRTRFFWGIITIAGNATGTAITTATAILTVTPLITSVLPVIALSQIVGGRLMTEIKDPANKPLR